jgi:hypothetical protein
MRYNGSRTNSFETGRGEAGNSGQGGSILLSLSLFIILLAFFIVLNTVSNFSEDKVEGAFASLDLAFAERFAETQFEAETADDRSQDNVNEGDSLESMEAMLQSILPGLSVELTENSITGQTMAVRMEKDRFDRLSNQLIPVFVRILNIKDGEKDYNLSIISYVRDPLSGRARASLDELLTYEQRFVDAGLNAERFNITLSKGNPAYFQFQFDKADF